MSRAVACMCVRTAGCCRTAALLASMPPHQSNHPAPTPFHHCRQYRQLEGHEFMLQSAIEREYAAALQRHAGRAIDGRAETHLQVRDARVRCV